MAASLPISHGPKLSPRSQLRSMVVMSVPLRAWIFGWSLQLVSESVRRQRIRRWRLPGPDVDGTDGAAGDVSISERLDVELKTVDRTQPVGQGAQKLRQFPDLCLRLRHADGLEPEDLSRRGLRETAEIGGNHGCDLGIAAAGA